jgi:NTE family protein
MEFIPFRGVAVKHIAVPVLFLFLLAAAAGADTFSISYENGKVVKRFPERSRPVIGLALSGGGARGIAHIGVIETLEKAGIRVERIAGTSMGSVVGGLYAAGYTPEVITSFLTDNDLSQILSSDPKRRNVYIGQKDINQWPVFDVRFSGFKPQLLPTSLSTGHKLASLLSWVTLGPTYECGGSFDRLPIPFRAVATNCITGNAKVLGSGNLARAIQASSTIPGLFAPVEWDDTLLIDGGLTNNLPVSTVREMGSDFIIAVAIEESMHSREELDNPLNMADQVTSIPMRNVTALSRRMADFVISPNMSGFSSKDFAPVLELVARGREAAIDSLPALMECISRASLPSRKTVIRTVSVSPAADSMMVSAVVFRKISAERITSYAGIAGCLEELWYSGRYFSIEAELNEQTGNLSIRVKYVPRTIAFRVIDREGRAVREGTEEIPFVDDGLFSMRSLIERVESRIHSIRSRHSGSTFASVAGCSLNASGDTLQVTVAVPLLTGIFIDEKIRTRTSVVSREIAMEIGDVFDLRRAMNSVDNLYGTNLFEQVFADVFPYEGGVGLRFHLEERDWTVARLGLNYNEFDGTEGRVSLSKENIFGYGNQFNAMLQTGSRIKMVMAENRNDRMFSSMYTFNLRAYRHHRIRPLYEKDALIRDYEDDRYGAILSIGQVMDKLGNVVLQFKSETSKIDYPQSSGIKDARREYRSIVVRSLIDSYDRYPFPRKGSLNNIYVESASTILGGTERFVKIFWNASMVRTLARRHTFSGSLFLGSADPSTPESESFSLGGSPSRLNSANAITANSLFYADFMGLRSEQKFGTKLAAAKASYRVFIPRYFYLDFTYGIGNVWKSAETITKDSLLQSYGVTGTFDTPLGPLSIGWGITSQGSDRVYMSAGREF